MIILISTFAQTLAKSDSEMDILNVLIIWRFIMGVDMERDCPLSAIIASEFALTSSYGQYLPLRARGTLVCSTIFTIKAGNIKINLAASLFALITVHAYK